MAPRLCAGRFSRAERARQRRLICLEDAALSEETKVRYYSALRLLLPVVEAVVQLSALDAAVSNWVHEQWKQGAPLLTIGDALCALHFFQPGTKRLLPHSWKLFGAWRRLEVPSRAPPLTCDIVQALSSFELAADNLEMSALLLLGFHCLLRTGELLALTADDLSLGPRSGVCCLRATKTSARHAANEVISITNSLVLEVVKSLKLYKQQCHLEAVPLWTSSPQKFRQRFAWLLQRFDLTSLGFRP